MSAQVQDIFVFVFGVVLSAFFSGSEAALISLPSTRIKQLIEENEKSESLSFLSKKTK